MNIFIRHKTDSDQLGLTVRHNVGHIFACQYRPYHTYMQSTTVTVTVTKVFILRFLLKDQKRITDSFTYIQ